MKKHLLPKEGEFYKANMHLHTTYSDGILTPEEVKDLYKKNGYSIVAFTDHELLRPHNYLADEEFLPITAVELATNEDDHYPFPYTKTYHLNLYAKDKNANCYSERDNQRIWPGKVRDFETEEQKEVNYRRVCTVESMNDVIAKANAEGFLVSYNHPAWSVQSYNDYADLKGVWGVEIFNTGSVLGGYPECENPWVDMLRLGANVFPLAADDAHGDWDTCGGWIMLKSEKLEYDTVMQALERGDFYASTGPQIEELYIEDGIVTVRCSAAKSIHVLAERRNTWAKHSANGEFVTEASFDINGYLKECNMPAKRYPHYIRVVVTDEYGKKAYSRAYRLEEIQ
jgi:hypothetical protein